MLFFFFFPKLVNRKLAISTFEEIMSNHEDYSCAEDILFNWRLSGRINGVRFFKGFDYHYIRRGDSATGTMTPLKLEENLKVWETIFDEASEDLKKPAADNLAGAVSFAFGKVFQKKLTITKQQKKEFWARYLKAKGLASKKSLLKCRLTKLACSLTGRIRKG